MVRILNRIVTRMILLAGLMTVITMVVGLIAYYLAVYYQVSSVSDHLPPKARQELQYLVRHNQRGSDRYFELYDRYGGDAPGISDLRFIAAIGLISMLAGGSVATILARRISKPITAVAKAAARVSAGDRSVRVDPADIRGETGELIESFNRMAADIEAYERERTVLTAGIAHELRTPLTILKGVCTGCRTGSSILRRAKPIACCVRSSNCPASSRIFARSPMPMPANSVSTCGTSISMPCCAWRSRTSVRPQRAPAWF